MGGSETRDVFGLVEHTLEGRFAIERPIAEGGFGVVYYGKQAALDRPVAVKVLKTPAKFDDAAKQQFLAGFAAEAKTIARITHPNIVQVHDYGVSEMPSGVRAAWMALEWLTGVTLEAELLQRRGMGGRSPAEALDLLRPALSALAVVHAAGVAHRDLKPANIMMVQGALRAEPKLLDFGIAKIMEPDEAPGSGVTQTRSGQIAFSPGYASPEQISQGRSGPWTDVHAMGLILTELLTDRAPLEGDDSSLVFQQIVDRVRPTPGKFGVSVGPWEAVLARALAVSPSERYRDAGEFVQALEATVTEATSACAISSRKAYTPAGSTPGAVAGDTLAAMSTQHAGSQPPPISPVSPVTTGSTPVVTPRPAVEMQPDTTRPRRSPSPAVVAAIVLAVAGALVLGWRATATRPETSAAATGVAEAPPPRPVDPPPMPAPPPPPEQPAVHAVQALEPAASDALPPRVDPVAVPPPVKAKPPAAGPVVGASPPAHPRTPGRATINCDPPFTIDSNGLKKYKPECNN